MILPLASFAFFISGFAALAYQIVWQRLLVLPIGADVYSTTLVVAAFMAGLGCGSLAGGYLADRLTPSRNLIAFVVAELSIGLFGFVSRYVFYDWQYLRLGSTAMPPIATAGLIFLSLLWPTFWMGISLPLLARGVARGIDGAARRVGLLYGLNTLGAATGAFGTTWILMPRAGLDGAVRFAAICNLLAATAVLVIAARREDGPGAAVVASARTGGEWRPGHTETGWSFRTWAALYAIAGFQALSLEIIWFRLLGVMLKASAFTFGTLLTIYLAGLGVGAALGSVALKRVKRPALAFLLLQAFIGLYAGASVAALVWLVGDSHSLPGLSEHFAAFEPFDVVAVFNGLGSPGGGGRFVRLLLVYFALPAVLVGPPTMAMGASFPLLQKIVLTDLRQIGRRVGLVLIANIAGSTLGSIATGWWALNWLGSATSLASMTALSGLFLILAANLVAKGSSGRRKALAVLAALGVVVLIASRVPGGLVLWARLHGSQPQSIHFGEDASGLSLIRTDARMLSRQTIFFVNGVSQSWVPYGSIHSVLGALPAFIHPAPRDAAVIGLGSGDTLYSLAGRLDLRRVTSVEIIRPQLATLRALAERSGYPALTKLIADPRITHVFGDGRIEVMRSGRLYDIIEADALRPISAYSGHLYSVGYFSLLRSRLAKGGLAITWAPTPRVHATFAAVFPHVLNFGDIVLGSSDPIHFDPEAVRTRIREPQVKAHYDLAGINIEQLLGQYLQGPARVSVAAMAPVVPGDLNEDLFPRDEFSVPRR